MKNLRELLLDCIGSLFLPLPLILGDGVVSFSAGSASAGVDEPFFDSLNRQVRWNDR